MNYIDDIAKLPVDGDTPNFQHFYDYGRHLQGNSRRPKEAKHIDAISMEPDKKTNLELFAQNLFRTICSSEVPFVPFFIELSVYDPADRAGKTFFSIFIGLSREIIECYLTQMDINLAQAKEHEAYKVSNERGPIIPSKKLHDSAFYSKNYKAQSVNIRFESLDMGQLTIYFGGFQDTDLREPSTYKGELDKHIQSFFDQTLAAWRPLMDVDHKKAANLLDYALLLPLFRPTGLSSARYERNYNGGGIFIYGSFSEYIHEADMIIQLQTRLTRAIFNISHANVVHEEIENLRSTSTVMLVHQIKNKLSNKIAEKLDFIISVDPEITPKTKCLIEETRDETKNIIKKFTNFLNNVRKEFSQANGPDLTYRNFKYLISQKKLERNIDCVVLENKEVEDIIVKIHLDILEMISDEFIDNAVAYYRKKNTPQENQRIEFVWQISDTPGFIKMYLKSLNSTFLEKNLGIYGRFPITDTKSTGLGGFLANEILKMGSAYKYPDGRYLQPINEGDDFILEIQFPIA